MIRPIYKAFISSDEDVWDVMGFVDDPAHGKEAFKFNRHKKEDVKYFYDDAKQIITGVAISANQLIPRYDDLGAYDMYFDKDTIRELGRRMLSSPNTGNVNINHNQGDKLTSVFLDELYYIDSKEGMKGHKSLEGQRIEDGSLIATYYVKDKKEYERAKKTKGFSIEVFIDVKRVNLQNQKSNIKMKENKKGFFDKVKALFEEEKENLEETQKVFAEATTVDGTTIKWEGELKEGETVIYQVIEGDDVLAPEGVHLISKDEKQLMLTIGADGVLEAMEEVTEEAEEMSEEQEAIEMNAKQIVALKKELAESQSTVKEFAKRFENIEKQIDINKKDFSKKTQTKKSIGQRLKK